MAVGFRDGRCEAVRLADDATELRDGEIVTDAADFARIEAAEGPRWLVDSVAETYPLLLAQGVRLGRCHDVALTERILLTRQSRFGEPCRAAAVVARASGRPVPEDPPIPDPEELAEARRQPGLFDSDAGPSTGMASWATVRAAYRNQRDRVGPLAAGPDVTAAGIAVPAGALRLLVAAESGSALVAAEMTRRGLPWDAAVHRRILAEALGPRPPEGGRPAAMARIADEITAAFGFPVNPDSPADVRQAFHRSGFDIESTRAWVLRELDHPAVAPVLRYKDLSRLYTANGWHWLDQWVRDGRLAAQFLPGAVVSGRWATRGGGGLQLPAAIRSAAVAEPGHVLVVADAAQLEPRVLAAVSRDPALAEVATDDDLYAGLATDGFGGDRKHAKLAMLGAMYGQTSGEAARLLATMRVRYPQAVGFVERAAERGERGAVVASVLGRACPPPSAAWRRVVGGGAAVGDGPASDDRAARRAARDRGRFTRNFVIQASAADWAAVWMTTLRLALRDVAGAEIVFFQHDELVIHVPRDEAERVCSLVIDAAETARDLVFPGSPVRIPVRPTPVRSYADAK